MTDYLRRGAELIVKWTTYRHAIEEPRRYLQLADDLHDVRNDTQQALSYPKELIDSDDLVMAEVEHYFLCRAWVGNDKHSWIVTAALASGYDVAKSVGLAPPTSLSHMPTPYSPIQGVFQQMGIRDGRRDLLNASARAETPGIMPGGGDAIASAAGVSVAAALVRSAAQLAGRAAAASAGAASAAQQSR